MELKVLKKDDIVNLMVQSKGGHLFTNRVKWDSLSGQDIDIDITAIVIGKDGKACGLCYYGNLNYENALIHSGDERTGVKADWDEIITLDSSKLPEAVSKIVIISNIYAPKGLAFKNMRNFEVGIFDEETQSPLATFLPSFEDNMANMGAVVLGEYVVHPSTKQLIFKALGEGYKDQYEIYELYGLSYEK